MKRTVRSFGFALAGLSHAFLHERNLRLFLLAHILLCTISVMIFRAIEIPLIIGMTLMGLFFIVIELLNTAIERLADTFDDCEKTHRGGHYHPGIKITKDVAAGASLIALLLYVLSVVLMIWILAIIRSSVTIS